MSASDKTTSDKTGNGQVKVAKKLRELLVELKAEESPHQKGMYFHANMDAKDEQVGTFYVYFEGHPEGLVKYNDGVETIEDLERLKKLPWSATFIRRRDEIVAEANKAIKEAYGAIPEEEKAPEVVKPASVPMKPEVKRDLQKEYDEHQAGKNQLPAVATKGQVSTAKKDFMTEIGVGPNATPKELAFEMGVGDKKQRYATNRGLWYAFYALGLKLKSCKIEHIHWSWTKGNEDPLAGVALCKSMIIVDNGTTEGQYYEAYAKASTEDVKLDDVKKRLDEMAETRAEDRCLRKITAGGWRKNFGGDPSQDKILQDIKQCEQVSAEEMAQYGGDV